MTSNAFSISWMKRQALSSTEFESCTRSYRPFSKKKVYVHSIAWESHSTPCFMKLQQPYRLKVRRRAPSCRKYGGATNLRTICCGRREIGRASGRERVE